MEEQAIQQIVSSLELVHDPRTSNRQRQEAQSLLETIKQNEDAPFWGWQLASPKQGYSPVVRHFGLGLIQHAIQYMFLYYDAPRKAAVRDWVIDLATNVTADDPHYIKEKLCVLWVNIAKRVWGVDKPTDTDTNNNTDSNNTDNNNNNNSNSSTTTDSSWKNMDALLVQMWDANLQTREISLGVFRTLFEDIWILEDTVAAKRSSILTAQCIEVVTSEEVLEQMYENRVAELRQLRQGSEGWINRWAAFLAELLAKGDEPQWVVQLLQTIKTCLYWVLPAAIRKADLLGLLSQAITSSDLNVQVEATECLHTLFTRPFSQDEEFQAIVGSVFLPQGISTLHGVYDSIRLDVNNLDERAYALTKKFVEMVVGLGEYLNVYKGCHLPAGSDVGGYLRLVLAIVQHDSLLVSSLTLQFWCSILRMDEVTGKQEAERLLPQLLEIAADRCIKYEDVDDSHVSVQYLEMDFDSPPERHMFLCNYRRFMDDIVRLCVYQNPVDSITWLQQRMAQFFSQENVAWQVFERDQFEEYKGNPAFFVSYCQFNLVEASLRGVSRWQALTKEDTDSWRAKEAEILRLVENWGTSLLGMNLRDPQLVRKSTQTLVQVAPMLKDRTQFVFQILERVISGCTYQLGGKSQDSLTDDERALIKEVHISCGTELNRLAYLMPDSLAPIYSDLERVVIDLFQSNKLTEHEGVAFKSFLLVVSQRCSASLTSPEERAHRFGTIVDPVFECWTDPGTVKGLTDLQWFMEHIGIVRIAEYFRSRGVTSSTNLLEEQMDEPGFQLRNQLKEKCSVLFPIRQTRIFLQYSIERLDRDSPEFLALLALWKPRIQPILPHILQLITQIQAYHNPKNWTTLPSEVQSFVKYSVQERFWQVGVSIKSKDEFVDENVKAMQSLRDFADSIGHIVRYTREYSFFAVSSISALNETLYEIPDIATNLWKALVGADDGVGITLHSWRHMVSMVVRPVIKNCPLNLVPEFMPQFLPHVLTKLDEVLTTKWGAMTNLQLPSAGDDNYDAMVTAEAADDEQLSDEMMDEHLLRQLTNVVGRFLIDLVGHEKASTPKTAQPPAPGAPPSNAKVLKKVTLTNKDILGPFLVLCNHVIGFRDSRCSFNVCLLLRGILPLILNKWGELDDFLVSEVMKTCIRIIHDPFYVEVHSEAGYIVTLIYTYISNESDSPAKLLLAYYNHQQQEGGHSSVTPQDIINFEKQLSNSNRSLRQQRGVVLDFLMYHHPMRPSEADGGQNSRQAQMQKLAKKQQAAQRKQLLSKKTDTGDLLMETEEEAGLGNLFGQ
ncbi:YALI0D04444p [Yarrowia lipolytica CLIB122]|uniref:YALI0D04444p n=2 Tax=Yarrowia lipolytica TaxID=4952 RepID=Q6CAA7_YARLI|nr:YALI0D04444p [Yarrowia lipolytica CLIB122]AOW03571.1 hypothetical protein YALI1_D05538g [Yarrowia lipolytica]KAB8284658.1 armadillo-type protein [Yarrowia lipolytica]KAE8171283.1 armadillo-type protein [Yarrowia lipolytica]KAJ8054801.1 armadillo-type protein [Yarrowia lipolytica]RMI96669.1 armadillo-type protein [Yarrowia lipolytica]|eukprot:XP_502405.2 YALI0D04444p [Yarrowia lipolytica CLIB122]